MSELSFEVAPGVSLPLHASAGAAAYPEDGGTYYELFEVADARMYASKTKHRRAVV